jgi:hypothetical protein
MNKNYIYLAVIVGLVGVLGYQIWNISAQDSTGAAYSDASEVVMYKNPGCQCCTKWASHMERAGFTVTEEPTDQLAAFKADQGVPYAMGACHTAIVGDYVVEGHVPIADVQRLLKEQPDAKGIAVPGMPAGSPGMESPNPEAYEVYLIGNDGSQSVYAEHNVE